jgi:hypothetical protein
LVVVSAESEVDVDDDSLRRRGDDDHAMTDRSERDA